jgi:Bax protein
LEHSHKNKIIILAFSIVIFQIYYIFDLKSENKNLINNSNNNTSSSSKIELEFIKNNIKINNQKTDETYLFYKNNRFFLRPEINLEPLLSTKDNNPNITNSVFLTVTEKKVRFFRIMVPIIRKVKKELDELHTEILQMREKDYLTHKDSIILQDLYETYKIDDQDIDKLLLAIKPHPVSVALAQAALESSWGTSSLFLKGNVVFLVWVSEKVKNRIPIQDPQDADKLKYVQSYDSLEESIKHYFEILGRVSVYESFRKVRSTTNDPYEIIKKLKFYAESRNEYVDKLRKIIYTNNLTKYD